MFIDILLKVLLIIAILIGVFAAVHLIIWLFILSVGLTINKKKVYTKPSKFYNWVMNFWYEYICRFVFRIKLTVTGTEQIPYGTRFLFVSNHRSNTDNFIHCYTMKKEQIAFISKTENFQRPFAGRFMRRNLYLELDRKSIKKSFLEIEKAISYIKNDVCSIGVFPEGTRSKTGELLEFKPGCFKIAEKSACPIVVGVTQGTELVKKNFPWKKTKVSFDIIRVFTPEELKGKNTVEVSDMIHNLMKEHIAKTVNK